MSVLYLVINSSPMQKPLTDKRYSQLVEFGSWTMDKTAIADLTTPLHE